MAVYSQECELFSNSNDCLIHTFEVCGGVNGNSHSLHGVWSARHHCRVLFC